MWKLIRAHIKADPGNETRSFPSGASVLFVLLVLSAILTKMHFDTIDRPNLFDQIHAHGQIVKHIAPAPYQYRILQPLLVDSIVKDLPKHYYRKAFAAAYGLIRFASFGVLFICVFVVLQRSFSRVMAFAGTLLLCAFIPFTFRNYYYQPTSILEYAVFAVTLWATVEKKIAWLYPAMLIGVLNRETAVFIPLIFILWHWPDLRKEDYMRVLPLLALWGVVFAGLRLLIPAPADLLDVGEYVTLNLTSYYDDLDVLLILLICFLPFTRWSRLPGEYRRLLLFNVVWIPLHFFASQWWEIRYYIPSLLVSLPAIICTMDPAVKEKARAVLPGS